MMGIIILFKLILLDDINNINSIDDANKLFGLPMIDIYCYNYILYYYSLSQEEAHYILLLKTKRNDKKVVEKYFFKELKPLHIGALTFHQWKCSMEAKDIYHLYYCNGLPSWEEEVRIDKLPLTFIYGVDKKYKSYIKKLFDKYEKLLILKYYIELFLPCQAIDLFSSLEIFFLISPDGKVVYKHGGVPPL